MRFLREVAVVALRDGRRLARRPWTTGLRTLVSLVGIVAVVAAWRVLPASQHDYGRLGNEIYDAWRELVLTSTWMLAPLLVALGVQEEREAGTLEMLALTELRTSALFAGVVVARTAAIALVVLGSVPVLGTAIGLGGFGIDQVVSTTVHAFSALVLLACVSGVFALTARHPLLPAVATWAWAFVSYGVIPVLTSSLVELRPPLATQYNPFMAALYEVSGVQSVGLVALTVAIVAPFGGAVLDIALSQDDDDDFGALSPARWTLERAQTVAWIVLVPTLLAMGFTWVLDIARWMHEDVSLPIRTGLYATFQTAASMVLLFKGVDWLHALGRRNAVRTAEALRRGLLHEVDLGDDPVYWRDRQFGAPTARMVAGFGTLGVLGVLVVTALGSARSAYETVPGLAMASAVAAGLLPGIACAVEEARAGAWSLLASTRITRFGLVRGKLKATIVAMAPGLLLAVALWAGLRQVWEPRPYLWVDTCAPQLPDTHELARIAVTAVWVLCQPLWLSMLALWTANRAGARWAWPAVVFAVSMWFVVPTAFSHPWVEAWLDVALPFASDHVWTCGERGLPVLLVVSTALHAGLVGLFAWLAARSLR
ncbi:MAG: hypothetical protein H6737_19870 [Alphaproteobacteria bacterium]|nr:hypothetical protein [Alphaproteobacteria bacterium]